MIRTVKLLTEEHAEDCFNCKYGHYSSFPTEVAYVCVNPNASSGIKCSEKVQDEPGLFDGSEDTALNIHPNEVEPLQKALDSVHNQMMFDKTVWKEPKEIMKQTTISNYLQRLHLEYEEICKVGFTGTIEDFVKYKATYGK